MLVLGYLQSESWNDWFESSKYLREYGAIGRRNELKPHTVWVRLPVLAPVSARRGRDEPGLRRIKQNAP